MSHMHQLQSHNVTTTQTVSCSHATVGCYHSNNKMHTRDSDILWLTFGFQVSSLQQRSIAHEHIRRMRRICMHHMHFTFTRGWCAGSYHRLRRRSGSLSSISSYIVCPFGRFGFRAQPFGFLLRSTLVSRSDSISYCGFFRGSVVL